MTDLKRPFALEGVSRRRFLQLVGLGSAGAVLAACSSSPSGAPSSKTFPIDALSSAKRPVDVKMWHSMTSNNLTTLQALVKSYNASQSKVKVSLLNQTSYTDTYTAYRAGLGTGDLPQIVQIQSIQLADMIDSKSVVPATEAIKADKTFDASDVLPSAMAYFTVDNIQYAMPWNCSAQIMYYNKQIFVKAGLDPAKPPSTFDEYHSMAAQVKKSKAAPYGTAIKLTSSNVEDWIAQTGTLLLNHENGRSGLATKVAFDDSTGSAIFSFLSEMFSTKVAEGTSEANYDNLLAIGNGSTAMAIDTSAALGTVLVLLGGGEYKNVGLGVGPLPGLDGPGDGVPYGGAGLYIVKQSTDEQQAGAWDFIKYLLTPDAMATWAIGSGYIPITHSAVTTEKIKKAWATTPEYKVAYDTLANSKTNPGTAGGVSGAFSQIETDVQNGMTLVSNGTSPSKALSQVVSTSNQAISSYNSSL